jgi:hypothetical protein
MKVFTIESQVQRRELLRFVFEHNLSDFGFRIYISGSNAIAREGLASSSSEEENVHRFLESTRPHPGIQEVILPIGGRRENIIVTTLKKKDVSFCQIFDIDVDIDSSGVESNGVFPGDGHRGRAEWRVLLLHAAYALQ